MHKGTVFTPVLSFFLAASPFLVSDVLAASACKGKAEQACASDGQCTWIDAYKRKDGVEIKGYCRARPPQRKQVSQNDR